MKPTRNPPKVVCPRCGPDMKYYSGRVEYTLCKECKNEINK